MDVMSNQERVTIIAEVGSNHDGNLESALAHIDAAAEAGADIVKFQGFLADEMVAKDDPNYGMLKQLEVPRDWYPKLMDRCRDCGVRFLSTATNHKTLDWMEEFGVWGYKLASCNITYWPLIERLVEIGKPIIFSTGLARLNEIDELANALTSRAFSDFAVLHCVSMYPTPPDALCLRNIAVLADRLPCPIGFSDHSVGIEAAIGAVAIGARIVEKHFTLTGEGFSPDHAVSSVPSEFAALCAAVRRMENSLGVGFEPDAGSLRDMRRSLHFSRDLKAGSLLSDEDIKVTRPEDGLSPKILQQIIGRRLVRDVQGDAAVQVEMIEGLETGINGK